MGKVTDKQLEKQNKVINKLGISASDYWSNKEEYDYAYESPDKYAVSQVVGGYDTYKGYSNRISDIREDNTSTSGVKDKDLVKMYIFDYLDLDYGQKALLYRSYYDSKEDKNTYNKVIVEYLNGRDDISYSEMETILKALGMNVDSKGNISW